MADYFGVGKINFFVFLVVYISVVGLVAALFDPVSAGLVPTQTELEKGASPFTGVDVYGKDTSTGMGKQSPGFIILSALDIIGKTMGTALSVFWLGFTFNIPGIPVMLRFFMVIPVVIVLLVVCLDIIIDILKAVFKVPLAG
jgi:hypothetical protein